MKQIRIADTTLLRGEGAFSFKERIEIARQLLSTGLYNVTQVAERAGFDSVSYFSAEFRRLTGETPSHYANK